ncbi:SP_1767 family glycosyltransferase [Streptococcus oricebi]|uniref:SP_1767 family glycosyltransferase n=1 Tax=Streptococcus oricebi TaxID=1547447 RepID=A0ABS5B2A6_9STRE|nr:SP_1767 family glycosyltransferase [Streptococcus oricebi]MBP2622964.1 SP_1767 family glycosyltransferase [Streptococcus oricebi]
MIRIVLAGDRAFQEQLATAIKSILFHNRAVKIYVLQQGIAPDWFVSLRQLARKLDSDLINVPIKAEDLDPSWQTQDHISLLTYARYLIPTYIKEKRVLYLDSDLLVRGELDSLFNLDLKGRLIGAVRDANGTGFNAGVLLIDNEAWKRQDLGRRLMAATQKVMLDLEAGKLADFNGDQTVLNQVLAQDWLELDKTYNLQVGHDLVAFYSGWQQQFEEEKEPLIIHYTTYRKPWNSLTAYRYRKLWWIYHDLDLGQIVQHHEGLYELEQQESEADLDCLILTNTQDLLHIKDLIEASPQCHFHIAAYTAMGDFLLGLASYGNVSLYPEIVDASLEQLAASCQLYLQLHAGQQGKLLDFFSQAGKPIFAFASFEMEDLPQFLFADDEPQALAQALKDFQPVEKLAPKAIALAANYAYQDQVLTTIKSISSHNHGVRFYLLNADFPTEWFRYVNQKLAPLGSEIINARVNADVLKTYKTNISYTVFLRYFIPDFVEEDRVLYLDCDLVVTADLTPLFETNLGAYPLAAVRDLGGRVYFGEEIFNAGVMLINNARWKQEKITQQLLDLTSQLHQEVAAADQSILNLVFKDRWLELDFTYNAISLHTMFAPKTFSYQEFPAIIHYLTERKPWRDFTQSIYREVWWYYRQLDWQDLTRKTARLQAELLLGQRTRSFACLVYTYSADLLHVESLIRALPDCHFYLAAPVVVSDQIARLLVYDNVSVCSDIAGLSNLLDFLVEESHILLDINAGEEVGGIVQRFRELGKPVLAFAGRAHGQQGQEIFADERPDLLAESIAKRAGLVSHFWPKVRGIAETLDYILAKKPSLARYGDGEIDLIAGRSIPYQDYEPELAGRLKELLGRPQEDDFLICLSDVFEDLERYNQSAQDFWRGHLAQYGSLYQEVCRAPWYGSTFISRPYMDLEDKGPAASYFAKLKQIWQDQDLLLVEGRHSRSGVGNDLFAGAKSIARIICPARNAFSKLEEIKEAVRKEGQERLILAMLGPTAKLLAFDLAKEGYRVLDLGHIDSEYEWFQMQAKHKVKLSHKHTAEHNFDQDIDLVEDQTYEEEILLDLSDL